MTFREGNIVVICGEEDRECEVCGKQDETRPYGPDGKRICYDCGMKDENTKARMLHVLFGDPLPPGVT